MEITMDNEALLKIYLKKLEEEAFTRLKERKLSPIDAMKEALNYIEGEMKGY
jgi:hypothetical protein